jgi:hypothetical protein
VLREQSEIDVMVEWFRRHFEDPAEHLPFEDGEYVWVYPEWSTEDGLRQQFADASAEAMQAAVEQIEQTADQWQWVRLTDLPAAVDRDGQRRVSFRVAVLAATEKALLVRLLDTPGKAWVPRSQIYSGGDVCCPGDVGELHIPAWLAEKWPETASRGKPA